MYVQLIRDADKLDILRVVQERLLGKHGSGTFTLPKGDDISSKVLGDVTHKESVRYGHIKNQIDRIFLRISLLFDINFLYTHKLIKDRGYYSMFRSRLPETQNIITALNTVDRCLESNLPTIFSSIGKKAASAIASQ